MQKKPTTSRNLKGFTLVEVIFVLAILGFVSIALTAFLLDTTRGLMWASNKALIVKDVRNFTARITREAFDANIGIVYEGFTLSQRNTAGDQKKSGQSGDCLVLVHKEPYPGFTDPEHYTELVVYFRLPDANGVGPVYRGQVEFPTPVEIDPSVSFEAFIAKHFPDDPTGFPVVLELSRGLTDGSLFQNRGENSFLINGEILHGNSTEEVTNTYNLTISPRG
jgi:prepilin-type N-terminal cleavage/methylation domain-containing protein